MRDGRKFDVYTLIRCVMWNENEGERFGYAVEREGKSGSYGGGKYALGLDWGVRCWGWDSVKSV